MARRTNTRRQAQPPISLSPQAIEGVPEAFALRPERDVSRAPVVVSAARRPALLLGAPRLARHLKLHPDRLIDALVVPIEDTGAIADLRSLDMDVAPLPSVRARAVRSLLDHGIGLAQLAACVPDLGSLSAASRWASLASSDPYVLGCLDKGTLSFSHASALIPLSHAQQRQWAERCVAGRWSHARLVRSLRESAGAARSENDLDVRSYAKAIQEKLGAKTEISWDSVSRRGEVSFEWFSIEELQGLMEQLGRAPPSEAALPFKSRRLVLSLESTDEIDALTAHLFASYD